MSDKNIQVAKEIYAAFSRGDVPAIMRTCPMTCRASVL